MQRRFAGLLLGIGQILGSSAFAGSIYLNGTDVTGARNQRLKDVDLFIDENGNVFIDAPHYTVNEQAQYIPLSPKLSQRNVPAHQAPFGLPSHPEAPLREAELQSEKAGSKIPAPEQPAAPETPAADAEQAPIPDGVQ